jgi:uncharacterized protein (TIGR02246 family)
MNQTDLGFTHIALPVCEMEQSITFYQEYAQLQVIHDRTDETTRSRVVWLSDLSRPFILVLITVPNVEAPLRPLGHLGVACESREQVDRLCETARSQGCLQDGPRDYGHPVGYWAFLSDPDGHTLEISYGQEVGFAVKESVTAIIEQAANAWIQQDPDAFAALFTPDGEFIVPGDRWVGYAAIRKAAASFAVNYSEVKIDIKQIIVEGNQAVVEWHWQDVQKATGKSSSADDAIVVEFQNGKISRWREYIDTRTVRSLTTFSAD